jgi:uracil-DNA glycosylase family 4
MEPELAAELSSILASARAHLEQEAALGGPGLPVSDALERLAARAAATPSAANPPRVTAPSSAPPAPSPVRSEPTVPAAAAPELGPELIQDASDRVVRLAQLATEAASCTACVLHEKRKQSVFARGNPSSEIVFVGEGPGAEEDRLGEPFVGPAGQLLDRMIAAMGYARDEVYICNVVKCRPPENRTPRPEEAIACSRFLKPQLALIGPKVIVALGRCAAENLGVAKPEGSWRGRWGSYEGVPVMPTYHPAYLLRSPEQKRIVWDDLKLVMGKLGKPVPPPKGRA